MKGLSDHGTDLRYINGPCRCNPCRQAHTERRRERRAVQYAYVAVHGLPSGVEHGDSAYCNWGCRCDVCTTDQRIKQRARKAAR